MKHEVITPDDLPIREQPFHSRRAAERAADKFAERFTSQGHYTTATGERIPADQVRSRLRVVPV